jgi:thiamine biosynthesis protein ThiS
MKSVLKMHIIVNGKDETAEAGCTIVDLLARLHLEPIRVAVEVNETLVPRRTFDRHSIREGDRIEIVTFVGGG